MKPIDILIYSWAGLFWLCLCVGFPPLALAYLYLPLWHRRRVARRHARDLERREQAFQAYWSKRR